jgi:hypothetical protein
MPLWSITTSRITPPEDPSRAIACEIAVVGEVIWCIDNSESQTTERTETAWQIAAQQETVPKTSGGIVQLSSHCSLRYAPATLPQRSMLRAQ